MDLEKKRLAQYDLEAKIKTYQEMIESTMKEINAAPTLSIELFFKTDLVKYKAKLSLAKEVLTLINK